MFSCVVLVENSESSGMILDLGQTSHNVEITPAYSNAVVKAVLPYFSDAANKLDLPVQRPIMQTDIDEIRIMPFRELSTTVVLKNGWAFRYWFGYVDKILNTRSYSILQNPDKIPLYYGKAKMTKDDAVQMARDILKKLGIPLEDVFAEQEPRVSGPVEIGTNAVPHYEIQWLDPRINSQIIGEDNLQTEKTALVVFPAVDIQINGETKELEEIVLVSKFLAESRPRIDVTPIPVLDWPSVNPEYARQLIPLMFRAIDEYVRKLSLPLPPLTSNNVAKVSISDNEGWPHAEIETTNGWRFVYRHTMVNGYYAPENLFSSDDRKIHIKDFEGKWNLTTNEAIEIVRQALKKQDYPTNNIHMEDAKTFIYAASVDRDQIPRLQFQWYYTVHGDLQSRLEAEVNMENGKLESLYYDDKVYWNSRPPIEFPISSGKYPAYPQ
jgi:hypothetical protein